MKFNKLAYIIAYPEYSSLPCSMHAYSECLTTKVSIPLFIFQVNCIGKFGFGITYIAKETRNIRNGNKIKQCIS